MNDFQKLVMPMLDRAGFVYERQTGWGGDEQAFLSAVAPQGSNVVLAIRASNTLVSYTAYDVLTRQAHENDLWLFNEVNQDWATGCVYYNDKRGTYNLRSELLMRDGPNPELLKFYIAHLSEAAMAVRTFNVPHLELPESGSFEMEEVYTALEAIGLRAKAAHHGRMLQVNLCDSEGTPFLLEFYCAAHRVFHLRGVHFSEHKIAVDASTIHRVHTLNQRLSMGKIAVHRPQNAVYYLNSLVLAWTRIDTDLMNELVGRAEHSMRLIKTLRGQAGRPESAGKNRHRVGGASPPRSKV